MFGKAKTMNAASVSAPAQVLPELPVLPRPSQPHIREEREHSMLADVGYDRGRPIAEAMPVAPGGRGDEDGGADDTGSVAVRADAGKPRNNASSSRASSPRRHYRYILEFSDGQRVEVRSRCVAGRMAPAAGDGYTSWVVLKDPTQQTSRRHFEFGVTSVGQVWVMDCDSANGTWLDSEETSIQLPKLVRSRMFPGDTLRFGGMHATLAAEPADG